MLTFRRRVIILMLLQQGIPISAAFHRLCCFQNAKYYKYFASLSRPPQMEVTPRIISRTFSKSAQHDPLLPPSFSADYSAAVGGRAKNHNQRSIKEQQHVHQIAWVTASGKLTFEAFAGETLRTAALREGIVSPHNGRAKIINCRGLGTCGTCAVEIQPTEQHSSQQQSLQAPVKPAVRSSIEELRLSLPPHNLSESSPSCKTNVRLACQVQVYGDLQVSKRSGFWGQGVDLAEDDASTVGEDGKKVLPFGELEFLLDNKSPSRPSQKENEQDKDGIDDEK